MDETEVWNAAEALFASGKFANAAELFGLVARGSRGDPLVWMRLAEAHLRAGHREQASRAFLEVARLHARRGSRARALATLSYGLSRLPSSRALTRAFVQL